MFCICIINDCPKPISFIPYIAYPISYTQKISKFQNFPKFHRISIFFSKFIKTNSKLKKFENSTYITRRTGGPRGDIGRGLIRHVIQILTCNIQYLTSLWWITIAYIILLNIIYSYKYLESDLIKHCTWYLSIRWVNR